MSNRFRPESKDTTFVLADGRTLSVRARRACFTNPCHSSIRVSPKTLDGTVPDLVQVRDLHIAYAGNYDAIMRDLLDAAVVERLSAQGGELLVARSSRSDIQGLVIWRGQFHEIAAWLPTEEESDGIAPLERLAGLRFTDTPSGLLVEAEHPDETVTVVSANFDVDGIGDFTVNPSEEAIPRIPSWSGKQLPTGELWRSTVSDTETSKPRHVFTLANKTTVTLMNPAPGALWPFPDQLQCLTDLSELSLS